MLAQAGQVVERAVGEVVDAADAVAAGDQPLGEVGADETGHAGDGDLQKAGTPEKTPNYSGFPLTAAG